MAEGTDTYKGLGVSLYGASEKKAIATGPDILTLTGYASQAGDYFVCQTENGTEEFVIATGGAVTVGAGDLTVTAGDLTVAAGDIVATAGDVEIASGYYLRFTAVPTCTPVTGLTLGDCFLLKTSNEYQIAICDDTTQDSLRYINTTSA